MNGWMLRHIPLPLLNYPFEVLVAVVTTMVGIFFLLTATSAGLLYAVPVGVTYIWTASMAVGGPLTLLGLFWRGDITFGGALERAGLYIIASAWACRALVVMFSLMTPAGLIASTIYAVISLACLLRIFSLGLATKVVVARSRREG